MPKMPKMSMPMKPMPAQSMPHPKMHAGMMKGRGGKKGGK